MSYDASFSSAYNVATFVGPTDPPVAGCVPFDPDFACCDEWDSYTPELQERAVTLAWSTLRTLSGGRVGNCTAIVRPCLGPPCNACTQWWRQNLEHTSGWIGVGIRDGNWVNCACGTPKCSCERMCEIVMPGPVAALAMVVLDCVEQPLSDYRVDNLNRIVRTDGGCFPTCQDMTAKVGEHGAFAIYYIPGIIPDPSGLWAAGVLSCEYAKACSGEKCRLPSSVTTISRQGVTMTMDEGMFSNGLTGIREVDAYLSSINPNKHRIPPMVWSPDVPWAKHRYETPQVRVT